MNKIGLRAKRRIETANHPVGQRILHTPLERVAGFSNGQAKDYLDAYRTLGNPTGEQQRSARIAQAIIEGVLPELDLEKIAAKQKPYRLPR